METTSETMIITSELIPLDPVLGTSQAEKSAYGIPREAAENVIPDVKMSMTMILRPNMSGNQAAIIWSKCQ